jgi:hypothetical protein
MTPDFIKMIRASFEAAEVEAIARDYRAGFESYTALVWRRVGGSYQACRAFPHKHNLLPL